MSKYYKKEDIHRFVTAAQVAEDILGVRIQAERSPASWRGGDNPNAVAYYKDGTYYDFVDKTGGDAAALLVAAGQAADYNVACEILGDRYCPQCAIEGKQRSGRKSKQAAPPIPATPAPIVVPTEAPKIADGDGVSLPVNEEFGLRVNAAPATSKCQQLEQDGWKQAWKYTYQDEFGEDILYVFRYEKDGKKQFVQLAANGQPTGQQIQAIYNLQAFAEASIIFIVEGEKCADLLIDRGYCATTNPGGAEKWTQWHSEKLHGKVVVILGDNDDKGRMHGAIVAASVAPFAASVKLLFPSDIPKGDVVDWFGGFHTNDEFDALVADAPFYEIPRIGQITPEMIATAKQANREPFSNYISVQVPGEKKPQIIPREINDMMADLQRRLLGFPYRLNDILFDWDKDLKEYKPLYNADSLFAWICAKTNHNYAWKHGEGFISRTEFFEFLFQRAKTFKALSSTPEIPMQDDVFYTFGEKIEVDSTHPKFNGLLNYFNPATEVDRTLLKIFFMSLMFNYPDNNKPLWVIEAIEGQGVGKTTLVKKMARLYSDINRDIIFDANLKTINTDPEKMIQNLVSAGGRYKRIFLMDNVTGQLSSDKLAEWITCKNFTARAAYSRDYADRPNNLLFIATSNEATFDKDLQTRMFILYLKEYDYKSSVNWSEEVNNYIDTNRLEILFEMYDMIQRRANYGFTSNKSRFALYEEVIGMAACDSEDEWRAVTEELNRRKLELNSDYENAAQAKRLIEAELAKFKKEIHMMNVQYFWLTNKAIDSIAARGGERFNSAKLRAWARDSDNILHGVVNPIKRQYKHETGVGWSCDSLPLRDGDGIGIVRKLDADSLECEKVTWGEQ